MNITTSFFLLFILFNVETKSLPTSDNSFTNQQKERMLDKVNKIRSRGCYCGWTWMDPAPPVKWNSTLEKSALSHAKDMTHNNFFAHYSRSGESIGERLDAFGYNWAVAGENLGEGQTSFREVVRDWLDSDSHCEMLMNPKVDEMAVAKYGKMWVQHFGKKMPKGAKKMGVKKSE